MPQQEGHDWRPSLAESGEKGTVTSAGQSGAPPLLCGLRMEDGEAPLAQQWPLWELGGHECFGETMDCFVEGNPWVLPTLLYLSSS
jgi:hypothetical protein